MRGDLQDFSLSQRGASCSGHPLGKKTHEVGWIHAEAPGRRAQPAAHWTWHRRSISSGEAGAACSLLRSGVSPHTFFVKVSFIVCYSFTSVLKKKKKKTFGRFLFSLFAEERQRATAPCRRRHGSVGQTGCGGGWATRSMGVARATGGRG